MDLNAHTKTVSGILSVKSKYIIPRYQREYSWEKEQVDELWSDVVHNIRLSDSKIKHHEYFIGALVLVGEDGSTNYDVVDGQQRLTTLTIFLSALAHRFVELGEDSLAEAIYDNYISGKDKKGRSYFKLENESPKPFLQTGIQHLEKDLDAKPVTEEERVLKKAYDRIYRHTSSAELTALKLPGEHVDWLEVVRDQIVDYLKVIFITVNDEDEAYTIFETLNARGVNLSFVDLIKTKIFKELNVTHPVDFAKDKWKTIRSLISQVEGGGMEQFMRHFWISKFSYSSAGKIYSEFVKRWKKGDVSSESLLADIVQAAHFYVQLIAPDPANWSSWEEKRIAESFRAFGVFQVSQQRSFLLSLLDAKERSVVRPALVAKVVEQIECFHFQFNAVCSKRPSGLEGTYSRAARDLRECKTSGEGRLVLDRLVGQLRDRLPSQEDFVAAFVRIEYSDRNSRRKPLVQYILRKFELHAGSGEKAISDLTIEHIASQVNAEEGYEAIGNLLPLGAKINSDAGSLEFEDKLVHYKESEFLMVKSFISELDDDNCIWGANLIQQRSDALARHGQSKVWAFNW